VFPKSESHWQAILQCKFSSNVEDTENVKDMDVNEVFDCTAEETEEVEAAITTIMIVNKHSNILTIA
jgi:hypothetical protein